MKDASEQGWNEERAVPEGEPTEPTEPTEPMTRRVGQSRAAWNCLYVLENSCIGYAMDYQRIESEVANKLKPSDRHHKFWSKYHVQARIWPTSKRLFLSKSRSAALYSATRIQFCGELGGGGAE